MAQQADETAPPVQLDPLPAVSAAGSEIQPAIIPFVVQPEPLIVPFAVPSVPADGELPPPTAVPIAIPAVEGIGDGSEPLSTVTDDSPEAATAAFPFSPWQSISAFGSPVSQSGLSGFNSGFASAAPYAAMLGESLRDGLGLGVSLTGTFDSNPSLGYGAADDNGQGDFFMTLGGNLSYRSRASTVNYSLNYSGGYSHYFTQSDLSGYNQSAGGSITYDRGPLSLGFTVGLGFGSGANRYYASVVDEISYNFGLNARYTLSPKTSLTANASQSFTSTSGGSGQDTSSFSLSSAALWRYSKLTEFGPGIRYSNTSGDSGGDRTSIGPTLNCNYVLTRKVSLNSSIGADFAEYENGESADPSLFTSIALNWRASSLWGMNLSLNRNAQASYSTASQFEEVTALRLGYNRQIRRASLNLGVGLETRTTEDSGGTATRQPDRDYFTLDSSLGMPVFANTTSASVFMRYSDQNGAAGETWDSFQIGFSLNRSF